MTILVYFLCVFGVSFYTATTDYLEPIKDNIQSSFTFNPTIYKIVETLLYCQACQSFWIGWLVQLYAFNIILPYYAFACFGLVHLINKFRS